jgi:hypothetical protein
MVNAWLKLVVRSGSTSKHTTRPGTSSGHGPSPFSNNHNLDHSRLAHALGKPTWEKYLEEVANVAGRLGSSPGLLQEWQASVIDPFKGTWDSLGEDEAIHVYLCMNRVENALRVNPAPALNHEVIFSGVVVRSSASLQPRSSTDSAFSL